MCFALSTTDGQGKCCVYTGPSLIHVHVNYAQQVPYPSWKSQECGRCQAWCGELPTAPGPSRWLCLTHWMSQSRRPHPCPQRPASPFHEGLSLTGGPFLLGLADDSFSFQTLLTPERGACLPVFSSSWFPVCLFYQIVRSGKTESVFHLFLNSILIYIRVIFYLYICICVCI